MSVDDKTQVACERCVRRAAILHVGDRWLCPECLGVEKAERINRAKEARAFGKEMRR